MAEIYEDSVLGRMEFGAVESHKVIISFVGEILFLYGNFGRTARRHQIEE